MAKSVEEVQLIWGARYLSKYGVEFSAVTGVGEETRSDGYCETCYYEYQAVIIDYRDKDDSYKEFEVSGRFSDFLDEFIAIGQED